MAKHVILTLEYDMGDWSREAEEGVLSTNPQDWEESFFQADVLIGDMEIVGVKIIEK